MQFKTITPDARAWYAPFYRDTPEHCADYTFTNLWGWNEEHHLLWAEKYGLCWIMQQRPGHDPVYWAPAGKWDAVDWPSIPEFRDGATLIRVPERLCAHLEQALPGRVIIEETPDEWEYVYDSSALAELKGNRLHKKKNHVNGFIKQYGEDYRPLSPELIPQALELEEKWLLAHADEQASPVMAAETRVGLKVLRHWEDSPELVGGALFAGETMVAFCAGEALDETMLVTHFEKGLVEYRGVYQAINCFFARHVRERFQYINREQDSGDPGLRQAKQSYGPAHMLRKNTVHISAAPSHTA